MSLMSCDVENGLSFLGSSSVHLITEPKSPETLEADGLNSLSMQSSS